MLASPLAGSCASHANANSKPVPFFPLYSSKTEFLSYVLLYLVKMPFPPVTKAQTHPCPANQRLAGPSPIFPDKTTEEKNLVKERLKKLTKKATPHKSKLPTSLSTAGMKLEGKSAWMTTTKPTQQSNLLASASSKRSFRNSTSGSTSATNSPAPLSTKKILPNSISTTSMASNIITDSSSPQAYSGCLEASSLENGEARNFTLNLTPEATLLLQKRCGKQHHGNVTVTRQSHLSTKLASRSNIPVLKISLLNDRHKYDDVEYEEDTDLGVDQSVLLKCSEWLRGVENAAGATVQTRMGSQKSF